MEEKIMEYVIWLLLMVLVGLMLSRKLPQIYQVWVNCYWVVLGVVIVQSMVFTPYRFFRVLYDLNHLLG